ncbi:MAG TPA: beta-galactosidase trimerization domain-containing protein, partial [Polyangia bacterium]|nr:beta-galactosidase trimerization domain-containing protein [Polyangia bacterium]
MSATTPTPLRRRFAIGANYWSRAGGPRMWSRFDAETVAAELAQLKQIGLDSLRMFAFAPDFMPSPPNVDAAMLARLQALAGLAETAGIDLWPTPLVGHMSGENFDFPGQESGRSLYRDPELLAWQEALVRAVVQALATRPNIGGWILSNEFPLWAGVPARGEADAWAERLVAAVRAIDNTRPVGTGDGCMAGWPTAQLASTVDYIGPHFYYGDVDPLRQAWNSDFVIRSMQGLGQAANRPVLLEEFGGSSTQAGEVEHAAYLREVMLAAFGCGAAGAFIWCASDFDRQTLGLEAPYSHHAFELGFGILRADGSEKPACEETRAMRQLVDGLTEPWTRPRARAALLRSDWQSQSFPFSWEDKGGLRRSLLQSYVLASQAGLDVDVIGEDDSLDGYALVLVPSTQKLRVPTWHKLEAAAHAGATIYWSYFSGENEFHQGAWCPNFTALTGLRHRLRYGCFDLPGERVVFKGEVALSLPTGEATSPRPQSLARLPIEAAPGATVETMAVDGAGRLALSEHRLGAGRVIFCAYPIERYLMERADGSARDVHRLYGVLAAEAGVDELYPTHHSDVQSRVLQSGRDDLVIVQHRGWSATVDDACEVPRDAELLY